MWEKGEGERRGGKENQLSGASLPAAMFRHVDFRKNTFGSWWLGIVLKLPVLTYPHGICTLLGRPWFEGHLVWVQAPESLRKPTLNLTHNLTSPGPLSPRGRGPSSCCILEPSGLDAPQCLSCKQWPLWCSGLNTGLPVVRSHLSFPSPPCIFLPFFSCSQFLPCWISCIPKGI